MNNKGLTLDELPDEVQLDLIDWLMDTATQEKMEELEGKYEMAALYSNTGREVVESGSSDWSEEDWMDYFYCDHCGAEYNGYENCKGLAAGINTPSGQHYICEDCGGESLGSEE